jgi:hypothetical protein
MLQTPASGKNSPESDLTEKLSAAAHVLEESPAAAGERLGSLEESPPELSSASTLPSPAAFRGGLRRLAENGAAAPND